MRVYLLFLAALVGCSTKPTAPEAVPAPKSPLPAVTPADPRPPLAVIAPTASDEFAAFAASLAQTKEPPTQLRERFTHLVGERKRAFAKEQNAQRRDFQADEAKARAEFNESQHQQRETFFAQKHDMADTGNFTHALDRERIKVIVEERAREKEFNRTLRRHRREFRATVGRRTAEFNEFYVRYLKRASSAPHEKNSVTGDALKQAEPSTARPLGTGD